ncbi:MAG: FeoB-associated Cys-rich membrane protein [Chloroflexi bacterium]|nr:FeoB-associated Cys-rich membrane protein [Chloroflexota bacterium]
MKPVDLLILAAVALCVIGVIRRLAKQRRGGRHPGCAGCPGCGRCHGCDKCGKKDDEKAPGGK